MPRANRCYLPQQVWHLTQRCHQKRFLLRFLRDRRRWRFWLFQARKRYGLSVLNYMVTSNHVHLLVRDRGRGEIARSMQLVSGRTAQEYNRRKARVGAFWEDRYHATAVDSEGYLARCMTYIDLNMVRAGVVTHPGEWSTCGYREIQQPPARYRIIDTPALLDLLGLPRAVDLRESCRQWVYQGLRDPGRTREEIWSEGLAVGGHEFAETFKAHLGVRGRHRTVGRAAGAYFVREHTDDYSVKTGTKRLA